MPLSGNGMIFNSHFHKHWQNNVKTWFNQPLRKQRRHKNRVEKAQRVAPRPVNRLRPIVHCSTVKYNVKQRLGRGFTHEELKQAGLNMKEAQSELNLSVVYQSNSNDLLLYSHWNCG